MIDIAIKYLYGLQNYYLYTTYKKDIIMSIPG